MQAAAHGRLKNIGDDIKKSVAKKFIAETPKKDRKRFSKKNADE